MKTLLVVLLLFQTMALAQQNEETVSIPRSQLTEQQKAQYAQDKTRSWVGMGKEIGEAVNSSMQAITTQSNNFAQTPVGKLTVLIVIWKVVGDQLLHVVGALLELLIFVPIWIWSYRRTCMTRRNKTGKDTWQVVEYQPRGDFPARSVHFAAIAALIGIFLVTMFTY